MELERAKKLLEILADGIDPTTGEILPSNDSVNNPEIIRALHVAIKTLDRQIWFNNRKKGSESHSHASNSGKPWTAEDDDKLCQMFDSGATKKDIRSALKRTDRAIAARLVSLKIISSRSEYEKDLLF